MTLTPLPPRPDQSDASRPRRLARPEAEELGQRIQQQAALIAEATCELLLMVADFDARDGTRCFVGLKSTAHWLAWACSMTPGTSREHVRVSRALPEMPLTVEEFRAGRLSYSKVREITRVVGRVDETMLVEMARAMTASQLARAISSFRAVDGSRLEQDAIREARWQTREDGMVEIRAVLPAEMGAEVVTALDLALDRDGHDPSIAESHADDPSSSGAAGPSPDDLAAKAAEISATPTLEQRKADALHDIARTFLDAEPDDRSGEDRHLVIVEVSADTLTDDVPAGTPEHALAPDVPAGPSEPSPASAAVDPDAVGPVLAPVPTPGTGAADDVPAGTPPRCGVIGQGPLESRTAERLACTGKVALMITDAGGEVLHLGRSRRLASRAQRRALRLRDRVCSFPGCHQSRHLDAHHTTPWSEGGATDIEGLALLCRRHHVMVHEGGLRLVPDSARATPLAPRFQVLDSAGRPVQARWPALHESVRVRPDAPAVPSAGQETDPGRIAATTGGAGFRLADCVDALCSSVLESAA
ncbi:MAG: HNH endonuclease [Brachybacterium sp.]|uniref:HNH endonuclease signature motif containing protein n=1 Tax=Brachybacterium sp. TaxID=1891286 RepID=UPI002648C147|nr:HNH endonuclease signature motif containing protein [Brachybacterium sp.]MDN5685993.1 HNH endonuclease [Brachybacterium sp.]